MIGTIVRKGLWALRRDRGAFVLSFVLPVAFFSIFALVFGGMGSSSTAKVHVIVVDADHSAVSMRLVDALKAEPSLWVSTQPNAKTGEPPPAAYTATSAEAAVRSGDAPAAILIPSGFGAHPISFGEAKGRPQFVILHDPSDPIAAQVASGLLQKSVMTSMPDVMAEQGIDYMDKAAGGLTGAQRAKLDADMAKFREYLKQPKKETAGKASGDSGMLAISMRAVAGDNKKQHSLISFYAAGIGVMFLLFTASAASGSLIDESESGALDRMLSARVGMTSLLTGKMLYSAILAFAQMVVMFLWGMAVFGLELVDHIPGFVVMTAATALAVSAFGVLLASLSRTRQQQSAISTLLILVMSAIGGSMFPRFLMPETMQQIGLFTFNAWALDGYTKVFWRDAPVWELWPQVGVLVGAMAAMFLLARLFARRWERA